MSKYPQELYNDIPQNEALEFCYEKIENRYMLELSEATCQEDVRDTLYYETNKIISHYKLNLDVEDVIEQCYSVWGIRD